MAEGHIIDIKLNTIEDYAPAITALLPLAATGIKEAIFLIRDISALWAKDEVTPEERAAWIASRKDAISRLKSHQFPSS